MTEQTPSPPPADEDRSETPAPPAGAEPPTQVTPPAPPAAFAAVTPGASAETPAPVPPAVTGAPPAQVPPIPAPAFDAPADASGRSPFPADRPEIAVGAAFAGGLVLALILKRLAR